MGPAYFKHCNRQGIVKVNKGDALHKIEKIIYPLLQGFGNPKFIFLGEDNWL